MSIFINRFNCVCRISREPEIKYTASGDAVAHFSIAIPSPRKGRDGNYETDFFDVKAWKKHAETASQYLHKGNIFALEGRLEQERWTDPKGAARSKVTIVTDKITLLPQGSGAEKQPTNTPTPKEPVKATASIEDSFYDATNFDPTPVDPNLFEDNTEPNF